VWNAGFLGVTRVWWRWWDLTLVWVKATKPDTYCLDFIIVTCWIVGECPSSQLAHVKRRAHVSPAACDWLVKLWYVSKIMDSEEEKHRAVELESVKTVRLLADESVAHPAFHYQRVGVTPVPYDLPMMWPTPSSSHKPVPLSQG